MCTSVKQCKPKFCSECNCCKIAQRDMVDDKVPFDVYCPLLDREILSKCDINDIGRDDVVPKDCPLFLLFDLGDDDSVSIDILDERMKELKEIERRMNKIMTEKMREVFEELKRIQMESPYSEQWEMPIHCVSSAYFAKIAWEGYSIDIFYFDGVRKNHILCIPKECKTRESIITWFTKEVDSVAKSVDENKKRWEEKEEKSAWEHYLELKERFKNRETSN